MDRKRRIEKFIVSRPDFKIDRTQLPDEDPLLMSTTIHQAIPQELRHMATQNYHSYRTNYKRVSPLLGGNFMVRLPLGTDPINVKSIHEVVRAVIHSCHPFGVRLNISFSLFLKNEEEEDNSVDHFIFYYASSNNHQLFETARFIKSLSDVDEILETVNYETISDHLDLARTSSKLRILHIASVLINALILPDTLQIVS